MSLVPESLASIPDDASFACPRHPVSRLSRTVGFWSSQALLIGSITGPGLVTIPVLYQTAGWFTPTLAFLLAACLSSLSALFICQVMSNIPGNDHFQAQIEFAYLVELFFGKRMRLLVHLWLFCAMQAVNVVSIVITAQMMDSLIIAIFGMTCGVQVNPATGWICTVTTSYSASPFGATWMFTSIGFLVAAAIIVPLCFFSLVDNVKFQIASIVLLIFIWLSWIVIFTWGLINHGQIDEFVFFKRDGQHSLLGMVLFNYAYLTMIPSWANVKHRNVSITKSVTMSNVIATLIYIGIGFVAASAIHIPTDSNILAVVQNYQHFSTLAVITAFVFPFALLVTTIPVSNTVIRYNLIRSGVFAPKTAFIVTLLFSWIAAIPFQTGINMDAMINWTSLIFASAVNFLLPLIMYIMMRKGWVPDLWKRSNNASLSDIEQQKDVSKKKEYGNGLVRKTTQSTGATLVANVDDDTENEKVENSIDMRRETKQWLRKLPMDEEVSLTSLRHDDKDNTVERFENNHLDETASFSLSHQSSHLSMNSSKSSLKVEEDNGNVHPDWIEHRRRARRKLPWFQTWKARTKAAVWARFPPWLQNAWTSLFPPRPIPDFCPDCEYEKPGEPYIAVHDKWHPTLISIISLIILISMIVAMFVLTIVDIIVDNANAPSMSSGVNLPALNQNYILV